MNYINNLSTGKIELHFTKEEYKNLTQEQKEWIKSGYLFSGSIGAWVSRTTATEQKPNNNNRAVRIAEHLGFTKGETVGGKTSETEEEKQIKKKDKAEARAKKYLEYAENADKRAEVMQKEIKSHHGDISYFSQPIIRGHRGSETFGRQREKAMERYMKGFEEKKKAEYYREKAQDILNKLK